MPSWQTIQSLLLFLGPLLLPRLISTYRSIRNAPPSQLQPLPAKTSRTLTLLFILATLSLLSTLPLFQPSNIFTQTHSRLQTPASVLLTRLAAIRPLTPSDELIRSVFDPPTSAPSTYNPGLSAGGSLEARLLYARFGPTVTLTNPFAKPGDKDAGTLYLLYALPSILAPHLVHIFALALATTAWLGGTTVARWRSFAVGFGLLLAAAEVLLVARYDDRANARSTRVGEVDFLFWKIAVWRGLAAAAGNLGLAAVVWLQGSGRAFGREKSAGEKVAEVAKVLEGVVGKARGVGVVRNAVERSREMKGVVDGYWVKEGEIMRGLMEEPEVLQAQRNALRRLDTARVSRDAEAFVNGMLMVAARPGPGVAGAVQ